MMEEKAALAVALRRSMAHLGVSPSSLTAVPVSEVEKQWKLLSLETIYAHVREGSALPKDGCNAKTGESFLDDRGGH